MLFFANLHCNSIMKIKVVLILFRRYFEFLLSLFLSFSQSPFSQDCPQLEHSNRKRCSCYPFLYLYLEFLPSRLSTMKHFRTSFQVPPILSFVFMPLFPSTMSETSALLFQVPMVLPFVFYQSSVHSWYTETFEEVISSFYHPSFFTQGAVYQNSPRLVH